MAQAVVSRRLSTRIDSKRRDFTDVMGDGLPVQQSLLGLRRAEHHHRFEAFRVAADGVSKEQRGTRLVDVSSAGAGI